MLVREGVQKLYALGISSNKVKLIWDSDPGQKGISENEK